MKPILSVAELLDLPSALVFDARFRLADPPAAERLFREGHIPNAQFLDLDRDLSGEKTPTSSRHPFPARETLARRFGGFGIGPDSHVVLYDDTDHAGAARAWALLRWLGFERVQVLDGGLKAWTAAGQPLEKGEGHPHRPASFPEKEPRLDLRTLGQLGDAPLGGELRDAPLGGGLSDAPLVDVRAPERYRGDVEPIDPIAGHIPGAKNLPYTSLLDANGKFLPPEELAKKLPKEKPIYYCGSGVTSCVAVLAHAVLGRDAALYAGSWSEWCRQPGAKIEKG